VLQGEDWQEQSREQHGLVSWWRGIGLWASLPSFSLSSCPSLQGSGEEVKETEGIHASCRDTFSAEPYPGEMLREPCRAMLCLSRIPVLSLGAQQVILAEALAISIRLSLNVKNKAWLPSAALPQRPREAPNPDCDGSCCSQCWRSPRANAWTII